MAGKRNSDDGGADKGKIRFIYAEVEGNNQSLQDLMKTMMNAMNTSRPVQIVNAQPQRTLANPAVDGDALNGDDLNGDGALNNGTEGSGAQSAGTPRAPRGAGTKKDRNASIKMVPNLDFVPDGKPSLKTFAADKAPDSDLEKILVATYYMQNTMGLEKIGPGHVRTALRHLGESIPLDLKQTIRNMKNDKNWLDYSDLDALRVATEGENHVDHEMPKKE